jgi:hypothetical protein
LSLIEMASECWFDTVPALVTFLDGLADQQHIHQATWREKGIVFLPAMWERISAYYRSKARKLEYSNVHQVVTALLAGVASPAQNHALRADPAPTNKPTNKPDKQGSKTVGHRDDGLLADAGADQVTALVTIWNTERKPGPLIRPPLEAKRHRAMATALRAHPNLDDWRKVIRYINTQDWCNAKGTGDHAGWRADIDYLIRPGKLTAALERIALDRSHGTDGTVGRDAARGRTGAKPGEFAAALKGDE